MRKTLKSKIKQAIKDDILTASNIMYEKIVIDENEDVSLMHEALNTPTGSIGVYHWQFGNGFKIDETTSDYRLGKVADRIVEKYQYSKKMREEYGV